MGGGSRSNFWIQTLSNVLNKSILIPADGDFGAAFGAARLALLAAEDVDPASVLTTPHIERRIEPNQATVSLYEQAYQHYRKIYPALKDL